MSEKGTKCSFDSTHIFYACAYGFCFAAEEYPEERLTFLSVVSLGPAAVNVGGSVNPSNVLLSAPENILRLFTEMELILQGRIYRRPFSTV